MNIRISPLILAGLAVSLLAASCSKSPNGSMMKKEVAPAMQETVVAEPPMKPADSSMTTDKVMAMEKEDAEKDKAMMASGTTGDAMMKKDEMMKKDAMMSTGTYKEYSAETLAVEQAMGHKVVLFFHAKWCPTCKAADANFNANLGKIPAGVTLLKTDYDTEKALKTKYGVTYQHTFVQVDKNGSKVTVWNGGDIDTLIANLK
jgi:thiol-disulfide isomerase/thioredoxin